MLIAAVFPFAGVLAVVTFRLLHTFVFGFPSTGSLPAGPLVTDSRGVIYGTTEGGGASEFSYGGTAFALTPKGNGYAYKVLHYFTGDHHPSLDGDQPTSGVTLDPAGNLYGTTLYGGAAAGAGAGTVFELQPTLTHYEERVLHRFTGGTTGSTDGSNPNAAPIVDLAGSLYGTTASGGGGACTIAGPGCGTVYEIQHAGTSYRERILYRFKGGADGATPQAALIADSAGNLYGTTQYGGTGCPNSPTLGCGTVFELSPGPAGSNVYHETVLYRFQGGASDGVAPLAALYLDPAGTLYGTTDLGGAGICASALFTYPSCGTAFMLQPSGAGYVETVLHNFIGGAGDGYKPESALVPGPGGFLYGTTAFGGTNTCFVYAGYNFGCGTVFAMSTIGGVTLLHSFGPGIGGYSPNGLLIDAAGDIFGTTPENWTAKGEGAAFEIAP
jgi:uncharacterized repeat protein (TIGR03803 family)